MSRLGPAPATDAALEGGTTLWEINAWLASLYARDLAMLPDPSASAKDWTIEDAMEDRRLYLAGC